MKTKLLITAICIISFLSVNLTYGHYPVSPYVFTGNNPVNRVDPDGQDWYSMTDKNGNVSYRYTEDYRSQRDLKTAGIEGTYIGMTGKTNDGSQYLSLFGTRVNTMTADGRTNLAVEMVANIDNAIMNSYKADYYNNPANRDPFNSETYSGATNMGISMAVKTAMVNRGLNSQFFDYAGGNVRYNVANDLTGGVLDWGKGNITTETGFTIKGRTGAFITIYRNNANFDVVKWGFPTTQSWQNVRNRANNLLLNRKW